MIIFICDDDFVMREYLQFLVREVVDVKIINLQIELFQNGEELLERCQSVIPDMVFVDYYMDQSGGVLIGTDVIRQLKKINKDYLLEGLDE